MTESVYGRNAVRECLRARRRHIHKLLLAKGIKQTAIITEIVQLAQTLKIPIKEVSRQQLNAMATAHQGVALETGRLPTVNLKDILNQSQKQPDPAFILALDHLEDPHNVGAILRTAEAVGVHGVLLPNRRSASITATVVNASAGATEHLPIAIISNLAQTLQQLKKENIWIVGAEKTASAQPYHQVDLTMPLVLVIGNEGKGLTRLISKTCDLHMKLPMRGKIESLNASVASALVLYEVWRMRKFLN